MDVDEYKQERAALTRSLPTVINEPHDPHRPPDEPVDRAWLNGHAAERAEAFRDERVAMNQLLRRERERTPLPARLEKVTQQIGALPGSSAMTLSHTPGRGSGPDARGSRPDGAREGDLAYVDPHEVARRLRQIELHVEALEDLVDEHRGLSRKSVALMSTAEKNELLTGPRFRGLRPEEITALHPELGAPRTIRWVRSRAGQRLDGTPKPVKVAA